MSDHIRDIAVKYAHLLSVSDYSALLDNADRIAELKTLLSVKQETIEAREKEIRRAYRQNERLREALRLVLPDLPRHKGECVNDNRYLEPEQITFVRCDYCIAGETLAEKDDED